MPGRPSNEHAQVRLATASALLERLLHDLKQPLNVMRVIAQDVKLDANKGRLDPAAIPGSMTEIMTLADEMAADIDRLRSFARSADQGARAFSVGAACRDAVARFSALHPTAEVVAHIDESLPTALGESAQLQQAVVELLVNAVEAGGARARIEIEVAQRGGEIVLTVRDEGPGVSPEVRSRIFEPFFSTKPHAAGLGLPLAAAVVRDLGGTLVLTAGGSGCAIEATLPVRVQVEGRTDDG